MDIIAFSSLASSVFFPVMGLVFLGYIMAHLFFVRSYFKHISKRLWPHLAVYVVAGRLSYVLGRFMGFAKYGIPMRISSTLLD
ncbi:hypothetical protein DRP04_10490 [Archaeoglobales archaeon]|nr:MAG: hypothetical protein DRP04_10490 [Archaeoglobales archaeon]